MERFKEDIIKKITESRKGIYINHIDNNDATITITMVINQTIDYKTLDIYMKEVELKYHGKL